MEIASYNHTLALHILPKKKKKQRAFVQDSRPDKILFPRNLCCNCTFADPSVTIFLHKITIAIIIISKKEKKLTISVNEMQFAIPKLERGGGIKR